MHPRLSQSHGKSPGCGESCSWRRRHGSRLGRMIQGFLGRLFRGGGSSASSPNSTAARTSPAALPYGRLRLGGSAGSARLSVCTDDRVSNYGGLPQTPVTTPPTPRTGPASGLRRRPRVSPAVTTADPLLTRFALGRSNDGSQFGMFLQIFADGTVDRLGRGAPPSRRRSQADRRHGAIGRAVLGLRGHCGAPATDFIEYVHVVIYERRLGRLIAHSFSYSGNTQGCDHAIRHLHTTLENLQAKLSRQAGGSQTPVGSTGNPLPLSPVPGPGSTPAFDHQPAPPAVNPGQAAPGGVIPLTPVDSSR